MIVTKKLLTNDFSHPQMILVCSVIMLALGLPPIKKAFSILSNRLRWLYIIGFLTVPLLFILLYILIGMNSLLNNGFLSTPWIMGTPLLITLHAFIALTFLLGLRKNLFSITRTLMS